MITRRKVLAAALASSAGAILAQRLAAAAGPRFEAELPVPRLIDARAQGNAVTLTASRGSHAFVPGRATGSYGYSGPVLGPAIRVRRGDEVEMTVENRIERNTTVHWHGLLIPGERDGGPHNVVAPGRIWRSALKIDQPEATAWFHPHPHGDTARQVYFGLGGLLLIDDGTAERVGLPRTYGVDDLPLVLQDRLFAGNGALVYDASPMTMMAGFRGDTVLVNATVAPVARVPAGVVRLRLLNASNARLYDLSFADRRSFHAIASDGGYLPAPVPLTRLVIAPGERYEILVDFSDGRAVVLQTAADNNLPMMGMMGGGMSPAAEIMKFEPDRGRPAQTAIPKSLVDLEHANAAAATRRRRFALNDMMMGMMGGMGGMGGMRGGGMGGSMMAINGRAFDVERVDVDLKLGATEIWEIFSESMAHPFHVHGVQFRVLTVDGRAAAKHLQGWKDTVLVPRTAEILVRFTQPASREHPFMYHCHILEHEDGGMMGQYVCT